MRSCRSRPYVTGLRKAVIEGHDPGRDPFMPPGWNFAMTAHTPEMSAELLCDRCGYDLRAHPEDGKCPECGMSVAESRRMAAIPVGRPGRDSDPRWRRRMLAGVWVLVLSAAHERVDGVRMDLERARAERFRFPRPVSCWTTLFSGTCVCMSRWSSASAWCCCSRKSGDGAAANSTGRVAGASYAVTLCCCSAASKSSSCAPGIGGHCSGFPEHAAEIPARSDATVRCREHGLPSLRTLPKRHLGCRACCVLVDRHSAGMRSALRRTSQQRSEMACGDPPRSARLVLDAAPCASRLVLPWPSRRD